MIKNYFSEEKTNSYRPKPWAWTLEPFPAFRGESHSYYAFIAVANGFVPIWDEKKEEVTYSQREECFRKALDQIIDPNLVEKYDFIHLENGEKNEEKLKKWNELCLILRDKEKKKFKQICRNNQYWLYPIEKVKEAEILEKKFEEEIKKTIPINIVTQGNSLNIKNKIKIIKTAKGGLLLVPCEEKEDEKIIFITATSGFRGGFGCCCVDGGEILYSKDGNKHCLGTIHMVARLQEKGYVYTETGRRSSYGEIEIYSWDGYIRLPKEEFEAWKESRGK